MKPTLTIGSKTDARAAEPPLPVQVCELVTGEQIASPFGPGLERHGESLQQYADAGVDELFVQRIGPEQDAFFTTWAREVLRAPANRVVAGRWRERPWSRRPGTRTASSAVCGSRSPTATSDTTGRKSGHQADSLKASQFAAGRDLSLPPDVTGPQITTASLEAIAGTLWGRGGVDGDGDAPPAVKGAHARTAMPVSRLVARRCSGARRLGGAAARCAFVRARRGGLSPTA